MRRTAWIVLAATVSSTFAGPAGAGFFDPTRSVLTINVGRLPPIPIRATRTGVTLVDDGSGGHTVTETARIWSVTKASPRTALTPNGFLSLTVFNQPGFFFDSFTAANPFAPGLLCGGPCLGGAAPLSGLMRFELLGAGLKFSLPLSVVGAAGGQSATAVTDDLGTIRISLLGAPWVTGTARIQNVRTPLITIPERHITGVALTLEPTPSENPMTVTSGGKPVFVTQVTVQGTNSLVSASQDGMVTRSSSCRSR
jgi:hypothetical protein